MKFNLLAGALALVLGRSNPHITHHKGNRPGRKDEANPESLKSAISAALEKRDADIRKLIEKCDAEISKTGEISAATKTALTEQATKGAELAERLNVMEQEFVKLRDGAGRPTDQGFKSFGQQFTESEEFKAATSKGASGFKGTIMLSGLKAVTNVTSATTGTGAAGVLVLPDRQPGIVGPALREFTIRDLMMPGRTNSNTIRYVRETGFQNMAAPTAEGTLKPQSDLSFAITDSPVRTIAHWLKASKQILDDVPMLETYIDTRLRYGLKYVEEAELLAGDGTGEHLLGLIPQATAYDTTKDVVGDTKIDTLRRAILQVRIAEYRASAIVLNPADWADIELTKDSVGQYIWVNVATGGSPQLWRLPVVDTNAIPAGHFLVGAMNMAAQVFDREDSNVQVSTEDGDNFVKNMVTIRAEERLAMVVYRPQSFVYGAFPA
jgi:HK97 family phage major capsid protein